MADQIKDGKGRGYLAEVNAQQRLKTEATVLSNMHTVSNDTGQAYVVTTGFIALTTTASFSGILYVKNTSATDHMHLVLIKDGQTIITEWKYIINPTTGTLISTATPATTTNLNLASNNSATITVYKGADALTITDGTEAAHWVENAGGVPIGLDGAVIIPQGGSIAFTVKPASAGDVSMAIMIYYDEAN